MQAPSLALPDLEKPFQLFVDTKQNVAVRVLTQRVGPWHRPVAYLSKQLDSVACGWPACLKAVAGTALLTQEASKLTFGQELEIHTPHLCTLHDCIQTIEETYSSRLLTDIPFRDPKCTLFTDSTSFLQDGIRKAGYVVVTLTDTWEVEPLPPGTSTQLPELHALTRALELARGG